MSKKAFANSKEDEKMQICPVCSQSSPKEKWVDEKCPACGARLMLADEATWCPNCGMVARRREIRNGRCPLCREESPDP